MVLIDHYVSHLFCSTSKTSFIQRYEYLKFVDLQQFPLQQFFLLVILHYCHWWIQAGWILQQAHQNLYNTWINIRDLAMKSWSQVTDYFVGNKVKNQDLFLVLFLRRIANNLHWKDIKVVVYRHMSNWVISLVQQIMWQDSINDALQLGVGHVGIPMAALSSEQCYFVG